MKHIKLFNETLDNEKDGINDLYDKDKYQTNKKLKIKNIINSFVDRNDIPENKEDLKEYLLNYSNQILNDFPIDNMIELIYRLSKSRSLIIELLESIIQNYKNENKGRSPLSPLYRSTLTKTVEVEKILDMLKDIEK